MAYERSKSAGDNFVKFIHQFQPKTKTLARKLERILIKSYRQNASLLLNQTCLNEILLPNYSHTYIIHMQLLTYIYTWTYRNQIFFTSAHIYIYIYIYIHTHTNPHNLTQYCLQTINWIYKWFLSGEFVGNFIF